MMEVLKLRHSLIGKSLLPVIFKVKSQNEDIPSESLARLKRDHTLTEYTLEDLKAQFEGLTGESLKDVLLLCGKEETLENARNLLHFAILQANLVGAPRGKALSVTPVTTASAATTSECRSAVDVPGSSQTASTILNSQPPQVSLTSKHVPADTGSNTDDHSNLEARLKQMEEKMDNFSNRSAEGQVDECLRHVRILASRPSLTQSHVLLAAIETLVGVSTKFSSKEAEYYSKAYTYCKKFEDSKDLCNLTMKLFGSAEDKKIANVVADWLKGKKYEPSSESNKENVHNVKNNSSMAFPAASGNQTPYFCPPPFFPGAAGNLFPPFMYPQPQGYAPFQGPAPVRSMGRGGGRSGIIRNRRCLYCKEPGHFVAQCPKIKKD